MLTRENVTLAKFTVYYTSKVPKEIEKFALIDSHSSIFKEGIANLMGFQCLKLNITVMATHSNSDHLRVITIKELLEKLSLEHKIEHFIRIS
jgi:hypothetical protein